MSSVPFVRLHPAEFGRQLPDHASDITQNSEITIRNTRERGLGYLFARFSLSCPLAYQFLIPEDFI
jgi:hypothetical protein